jgi:hypothetical protein
MDNRYFKYGCPPLMQDARFITNYMESRIFEQYIRNVNKIDSAQEFKRFLQVHGDTIINKERAYQQKMNTCEVHGTCAPLSGIPNSCAIYPNANYGSACGCACSSSNKQ